MIDQALGALQTTKNKCVAVNHSLFTDAENVHSQRVASGIIINWWTWWKVLRVSVTQHVRKMHLAVGQWTAGRNLYIFAAHQ